MTYKHGIPSHAVESTHKFFHRVYVGKLGGKNGEDENGYKMSWDSRHEKLESSETYGQYYCVYCGERPMPIQPVDMGYEVSGHVCLCSDAQLEIKVRQELLELEEKHRLETQSLQRLLPKASDDVKRKIIQNNLKDDYYLDRMMKGLGY